MDYRHVFATNLRRLRHEKGFSQEALAYEAGVNRTYMSKLEKGGSFVGLEVMVRLAAVLAVEPGDFLKPPPRKAPRSPKAARKR
jgi:transcriptional regulator with XRE-family HTH domain